MAAIPLDLHANYGALDRAVPVAAAGMHLFHFIRSPS